MLNATLCTLDTHGNPGILSPLQCNIIIQEYLPRDNLIESIDRKSALRLISEGLFDRQQKAFLHRLNLISKYFDTFAYMIDKSLILEKKYREANSLEVDYLLDTVPNFSTKDQNGISTKINIVLANLLASSINNQLVIFDSIKENKK